MDDELRNTIVRLIADVMKIDDPPEVDDNADYTRLFHINSLRFIRIMERIEKTFDITIDDDDFAMDRFDTIGKIAAYVRKAGYGG